MTPDAIVPFPKLSELLAEAPAMKVFVAGDLILDRYLFGEVSRVSPEAPVPILRERDGEERLGGAGNVVANLAGLGAKVRGIGVVGSDPEGERLRGLLGRRGVAVADRSRPTTVKTRAVARGQQVLRVDREATEPVRGAVEEEIIALASREARGQDALVISDYGKGVCTRGVLEVLFRIAREEGIPCVVDPKGTDLDRYRGATVLTPNLAEAESALRVSSRDEAGFREAMAEAVRTLGLQGMVVTRGSAGISIYEGGGEESWIPARARAVYDVTGAGDTVTAAIAIALARRADLPEAVAFANLAAGIVVAKVGAVPATRREVFSTMAGPGEEKILDRRALGGVLGERRKRGDRIVFTNGCFDILHVGHVRLMRYARSLGDCLLVGLNTDRSVRTGKGKGRPIVPERDRAEMIAGLDAVDYVTLFDEAIPEQLIQEVRPDVLVKGSDYEGEVVVGREFVESYGGEVILAPMVDGVSTSAIIERIRGS